MNDNNTRIPTLHRYYRQYLVSQDSASFIKSVSQTYLVSTLQRLAEHGDPISRRAAILAIGLIGGYESNPVVGRALNDQDRGVRLVAENTIRHIWSRAGNVVQRQKLGIIIRLNSSQQCQKAIDKASDLIAMAPWYAEALNQRAIAYYALEKYNESIADCHQALEINPYHFGAAAGMGQCYIETNDCSSAIECFQRALKLNPGLEGVRAQLTFLQRLMEEK